MSGLDFLENMNEIDEGYIRESVPEKKVRRTDQRLILLAASLVLLALALGIGIPLLGKSGKGESERLAEENSTAKEGRGQLAEGSDVLYEDDSVIVTRITKRSKASDVDYCLNYYTERELFEKCSVLIRGRVSDVTNVSIQNKISGWITDASVLTVEPLRVIRGELKTEGPVRVFVNKYIGTSLETLTLSLNNAKIGEEGILLLSEYRTGSGYLEELADIGAGDSQRFAIWSNGEKLLFDATAFPGILESWTLDEAESYIRSVLADNEPAPDDFAFSISISRKYYGFSNPIENYCYSFNSTDSLFSYVGDSSKEAFISPEDLTAVLKLKREELNDIYRSIKRLYELPDVLSSSGDAGSTYTKDVIDEFEISFTANGKQKRVYYLGPSDYADIEFRRLEQTEIEIRQILDHNEDMINWQYQLTRLEIEKRAESTEKAGE